MTTKQHKKEKAGRLIYRYIMMLIGASLAAVSIELFLVPNSVIDGGIIGISLILVYLTKLPFSLLIIIFNLLFYIVDTNKLVVTSAFHLCLQLLLYPL